MSIYLAYALLIYVIATVLYLICTRYVNTPLINSYTDEQKMIRKNSAEKRLRIFLAGIAVASVGLYIFKPFEKCMY
jgi:hypothetical protein